MKKLFTIAMLMLLTGIYTVAQAPWIRDNNSQSTYLKFDADKTGFGTVNPVEKVTIQSSSGETNLGLKPARNQSNSVMKFYNSSGVVVAEIWPTSYGFIIGSSKDTTKALLVANTQKGYLKVNGTLRSSGSNDIKYIAGDTTVAVKGKTVFNGADSSFYGCRSTTSAHKWYKLN